MSVRSVNATEVAHHAIAAAIVAPIDAHGIDHAIEDDKNFILTKLSTFSYSYKNLVFLQSRSSFFARVKGEHVYRTSQVSNFYRQVHP